ncbi:MAG TPA: ATP synthase subunit I [Steroidobacteraceae bacterium]|nr:ATP synthase subunit I [Steroidobacteraceae bacterium]
MAIDLPRARRLALRVVLGQALVSVIAALCALGLAGGRAGISALLGGGIATVASFAMAGLVFGAGGAARALAMFYIGEAVKLLIVVVLFVVVLRLVKVAPLAMFAAFAATFLVYWIALLSALPALSGARR